MINCTFSQISNIIHDDHPHSTNTKPKRQPRNFKFIKLKRKKFKKRSLNTKRTFLSKRDKIS